MGWLIYSPEERVEPHAECVRLCTWDSDTSSGRVLASSSTHGAFYAAVERTDKASGEALTLAVVFLIQRHPFGYKDMDETIGPNEASPSLEVLQALSPLPARQPRHCGTCDGFGKLSGAQIAAHAQGRSCFSCAGTGSHDRYDYARGWRKKAWARFGGEPQGQQLALIA